MLVSSSYAFTWTVHIGPLEVLNDISHHNKNPTSVRPATRIASDEALTTPRILAPQFRAYNRVSRQAIVIPFVF